MATNISGLGTTSIDGLISNLNTTDLITKLIDIERNPIKLLQQQQTDLGKQKTTWSDLSARLLALKAMVNPLTVVPTFQMKSATSSDTSILTASASTAATAASYTARVQQLALAHSVGTDSHLTSESSNALKTMLTDEGIPGAAALTAAETFTVTVGSSTKTITEDTTTKKLSDLLTDINTQAGDLVTATIINDSPTTQKLVLTSKTAGRAGEIYFKDSANGLLQKLGLLDNGTAVTGVDYTNDFSNPATIADFTVMGGVWGIAGGVLDQSAAGLAQARETAAGALSGSNTYSNVQASVNMNLQNDLASTNGVLWLRADAALNNGYKVSVTADKNPAGFNKWNLELFRVVGGVSTQIASYNYTFQSGTNYKVTARAEGQNIQILLNDAPVISFTDTNAAAPTSGQVALETNDAHTQFDNLEIRRISAKNVLQRPQDAVFTLNNVPVISSSNTNTNAINGVTLNLLSAASSTDVNLTVAADTASVKASINSFVGQYNDLVNFFRQQTQFSEGQTTVGSLFGNGLLLDMQTQLQNLAMSNVDALQHTEFVGIGNGNLGGVFGDFSLQNEITDVSDVKKVTVGSTDYAVREEGGAFAGGGNQVEVRLNGQLRFFDNTGAAVPITSGQTINVDYKPAEKVAGSGGSTSGDYNLSKDITSNLNNIQRIIASEDADANPATVDTASEKYTVIGQNILQNGGATNLADGKYVEVITASGTTNGAIRFFKVAAGVATAINVNTDTVRALYRGSNDYGSLAQIGVTVNDITDSTLKVDSSALDAALTTNLQGVQELFNEYTQSVATALNNYLNDATKSDGTIAGIQTGIKDEIDSIQNTINNKEEIIAQHQARLQKQFADMEATLGVLQAQSTWLQEQISKLPQGFTLSGG